LLLFFYNAKRIITQDDLKSPEYTNRHPEYSLTCQFIR